ncbi:MAG: chemotaxis protein CheW [Nitrospiraceae bacterium]|nr:chemotaxis protein CheW [Nitrospiraceae bacterium]
MSGEGPAGGIDWAEVRRRLEKAGSAADRAPDPGEKKNILRKRALALAKEPEAPDSGEHIDVLEFLLARERYAVESSYVREVWPLKDLTPVPCTPPFVLGIIGVRGRILSVLDLKKFLNLP